MEKSVTFTGACANEIIRRNNSGFFLTKGKSEIMLELQILPGKNTRGYMKFDFDHHVLYRFISFEMLKLLKCPLLCITSMCLR